MLFFSGNYYLPVFPPPGWLRPRKNFKKKSLAHVAQLCGILDNRLNSLTK